MGKAARAKAERRRKRQARVAEFGVFCPGSLEVLSIGKGDLKLQVGGDDPADIAKARSLIEEMLRKGYSIFVETDAGPVKVTRFNPKRMTYIVAEAPAEPEREHAAGAPVTDAEAIECPSCGKKLASPRYDLSRGTIPKHRVSRGNSAYCDQEGEAIAPADVVPGKAKKVRHVPVAGSKATAVGRTSGG